MEIPTYPYDKEVSGYCLNDIVSLQIDKLFRNQLASQMEAIVTFSDADQIFGQRTIKISNGIDFDSIPLHQPKTLGRDTTCQSTVAVPSRPTTVRQTSTTAW